MDRNVARSRQNCNRNLEKIVQNEAKSPDKNSGKMREKRMRCCKIIFKYGDMKGNVSGCFF